MSIQPFSFTGENHTATINDYPKVAAEIRLNGYKPIIERIFHERNYYEEMVATKEYRKDPYKYIINGLIKRGVGCCFGDDYKWDRAIESFPNFGEYVNDEFLIKIAEEKFSNDPKYQKIMKCFKKSLRTIEFKREWKYGCKHKCSTHLATALYIFSESQKLVLFCNPPINTDE